MHLKNLSESELLLKTKTLVAEEKRLTLEILHHQVEEKLKKGEIHLSTLASVRSFLKTETKKYNQKEKEELIEKVANKSTREVEKIFLSISHTYQPTSLKDKQVQLAPQETISLYPSTHTKSSAATRSKSVRIYKSHYKRALYRNARTTV